MHSAIRPDPRKQCRPNVGVGAWRPVNEAQFEEVIERDGIVRINRLERPLDIFRSPNELPIEEFEDVWCRGTSLDDGTRLPDAIDLLVVRQETGRDKDIQDSALLEARAEQEYFDKLSGASEEEAPVRLICCPPSRNEKGAHFQLFFFSGSSSMNNSDSFPSMKRKLSSITHGSLALLLVSALSLPASTDWTGDGADNHWSNPDNWSNEAPDGTMDIRFRGITQTTTHNDIDDLLLETKLRIEDEADWILEGNSISLDERGGIFASPGRGEPRTHSLNFDIHLPSAGDPVIQAGRDTTIVFNGNISGFTAGHYSLAANGIGGGIIRLAGNNTFNQDLHIRAGTTEVADVAYSGENSSAGSGKIFWLGHTDTTGTLRYTGPGHSTNRMVRVGNGESVDYIGGATILNDGTGALQFTSETFNPHYGDPDACRLITLGGTYKGINRIDGIIANNAGSGTIGVVVTGSTWQLDAMGTYTGPTTVRDAGTLILNGTISAASPVSVEAGGAIGGSGTIEGDLSLSQGAAFAFSMKGTLKIQDKLELDSSFGVGSLRNPDGRNIDWSSIPPGTYTLIEGAKLSPTFFNARNIRNFGMERRASDLGGGKEAYFQNVQNGGLQLVVALK